MDRMNSKNAYKRPSFVTGSFLKSVAKQLSVEHFVKQDFLGGPCVPNQIYVVKKYHKASLKSFEPFIGENSFYKS